MQTDVTTPAATEPVQLIPVDAEYWLALSRLPGVGRATFLRIIESFKSPKDAWQLSDTEWNNAEVSRVKLETHLHRGDALAWATNQIERLSKSRWSLVVYGGEGFPPSLSSLRYPPPYLFMLGTLPDPPSLAVVGSRKVTEYGARITRDLTEELAAAGLTIVSGFARGIDTIAHKAAIAVNGKTIAVWGTGPDEVYPEENKDLVDEVAAHGCVVTEFPFGLAPDAANFPVRNRLIAGLSDGVLVAQARRKSGALLTAEHALEQGKEIFAIPGEIGQESFVGTHGLLKQGARIVTCADDILSVFQMGTPRRRDRENAPANIIATPMPPLNDIERRVYDGLGTTACHIDRLSVSLQMSVGETARVLTMLELKGLVTKQAGNLIARAR
jgi:DNA processing protein